MPVLNEGAYIDIGIQAIFSQKYPADRLEILIVDGGSKDDTVERANAIARRDSRVRVITQGFLNCPEAMNLGISLAKGKYVAKVDGHGYVNDAFIASGVTALESDPSVHCVGGVIIPVGDAPSAKANRIARFSRFGVGGSVYTLRPKVQFVESVQCGLYRRDALMAVGNFDPGLQFGEDEEVNYRICRAGGRILYHPDMTFTYNIRPTVMGLFRQYRNYGMARVKVVRKFPAFLKIKHIIPALMVLAMLLSPVFLLMPGVYRMVAAHGTKKNNT